MRFVALLGLVDVRSTAAHAMNAQDEIAAGCAHAVVQFANSYLQAMREGVAEETAVIFLHKKLDETESEANAIGKHPRPNRAAFERLVRSIYAGEGEQEAMIELHKECMAIENRMLGVSV